MSGPTRNLWPWRAAAALAIIAAAGAAALFAGPGLIHRFGVPSRPIRPDGIVVHHSATLPWNQDDENAAAIGRDHEKRGLARRCNGEVYHIAYHYVILPDGTIEPGRPENCLGGHTRSDRHNRWIGICLVGYFDPKWKAAKYTRPSKAQMESLTRLTLELMERYDFDAGHILPHREVNPTECPGKSFPWDEYLRGVEKKRAAEKPVPGPGVM
jgi:hypothetical protein